MAKAPDNTQLMTLEVWKVRQVVDELMASPTPAGAIASLVSRANSPDATTFERYAGMALRDAGATRLADIPPRCTVLLSPPGEARLARLTCTSPLEREDALLVGRIEDCINRISSIADALEDSGVAPGAQQGGRTLAISQLGIGYHQNRANYRSANIALPPIARSYQPTMAYFNEVDWRVLDHVAVTAHYVFQSSLIPNLRQSVMGAYAPDGSDWDVRTRLAANLEQLELPLRCGFQFDCDVPQRAVSVRFTLPPHDAFPRRVGDGSLTGLYDIRDAGSGEADPHFAAAGDAFGAPSPDGAGSAAGASFPTEAGDAFGTPSPTAMASAAGIPAPVEEGGAPGMPAPAAAGERSHAARMAYAMRLACLVGAACFGSGKRIERAYVAGVDALDGRLLLSCAFGRDHFVRNVLTCIDTGVLASPYLRFNPQAIAQFIGPCVLGFANTPDDAQVPAPPRIAQGTRIDPWEDDRELPPKMRALFHAHAVSDIDTHHYHGGKAHVVDEARRDARDSLVAAIAHLEGVVHDLEAETFPPNDDARARPLYCANPFARAVVTLLDDALSVSDEADRFLRAEEMARHPERPEGGAAAAPESDVSYFRAPHALFHAHMGLSDLYEQLGDVSGAETEANRCIALAPTTAQAHFRKADLLAQQSRFPEAANVLLGALEYAVTAPDCALLYYHLALLLWNLDRKREAAAAHVYAASFEGEFAERAAKAVEGLRKRDDSPVIAFASPLAAARELARARIPVAPSEPARVLIVHAALGLSCADAPKAAAPYAAALARYLRDDRILAQTAHSLAHGITE